MEVKKKILISKVNSKPVLLPAAGSAQTNNKKISHEIPKQRDALAKYDFTADLESVGWEGIQQSKIERLYECDICVVPGSDRLARCDLFLMQIY